MINNNIKIKYKMLIMCGIIVIIPILVAVYIYISMRGILIDREFKEAYMSVDRIAYKFNDMTATVNNLSNKILLDENLKKISETKYYNKYDFFEENKKFDLFTSSISSINSIQNIRFYCDNETINDNSQWIYTNDDILSLQWFQRAYNENGKILWQYMQDIVDKNYHFTLTRALRIKKQNIGVVTISINDSFLHSLLEDEPYDIIMTTNEGVIFNSSDKSIIGTKLTENQNGFSVQSENNEIIKDIYFCDYKVIENACHLNSDSKTTYIYAFIKIKDITNKATATSKTALIFILISLILSALLIIFFSGKISKRMVALEDEMEKITVGNFEITENKQLCGRDEIGSLFSYLNYVKKVIKHLIDENKKAEYRHQNSYKQLKNMEFRMLASQISPHFLFNVLETLRMTALCRQQRDLAKNINLVAKFLRHSLEVSGELEKLKDDIDNVQTYLEIQKFRFGDRFSFEINLNCNIDDYYILPLLIQPIVENAFKHGLESKSGTGKIILNIDNLQNNMVISVSDDGDGIPKEKLQNIKTMLMDSNKPDKHLGIYNVNKRIKLYYGESYGVDIESVYKSDNQASSGTVVTIRLPNESKNNMFDL